VRKREPHGGRPHKTDPRIIKTDLALGAALRDLMLAEDFDAITVQRVLERADVSRSAFYSHYRNTHDLLVSDAERFLTMLESGFMRASVGTLRVAPVAELFQHAREFREFVRALDRSGKGGVVSDLVAGHIARIIEARLRVLKVSEDGTMPLPVAARLFAAAFVALMDWWIERDDAPPAAWAEATFHELVWCGLNRGAESTRRP
jgi:AcrR family transcriptional regulator